MTGGQDQEFELELVCRSLAQRLFLLEDLCGRAGDTAADLDLICRQLPLLRAEFREAHLRWCIVQKRLRLDPWIQQALVA